MQWVIISLVLLLGISQLWSGSARTVPAWADITARQKTVAYQYQISPVDSLEVATAYVVIDEMTGEVLLEKSADTILPIASVAKLFVAGAALNSGQLMSTTTIVASDISTASNFGKLTVGDTYSLQELLFPYLLESSNDAGLAIWRQWGEVVTNEIMSLIKTAGLDSDLSLADFTGLSTETKTSARTIAKLTKALASSTPQLFDITLLPRYVDKTDTLVNNNPVLAEPGYLGGKHGYTETAGRTLVARLQTAFPDGDRVLIYVILGANKPQPALETLIATVANKVDRQPVDTNSAILDEPN